MVGVTRTLGYLWILCYRSQYLKVIPANGNNGLRGDRDLSQDQASFATAIDQTIGDDIVFTLIPEPASVLIRGFGLLVTTLVRARSSHARFIP